MAMRMDWLLLLLGPESPCLCKGGPFQPCSMVLAGEIVTKAAVWVQVKVLELEKRLEGERVRLGELRKQHYALAGTYDATEDGDVKPAPAPRRGILKKPPLAQKPAPTEVGSSGGR